MSTLTTRMLHWLLFIRFGRFELGKAPAGADRRNVAAYMLKIRRLNTSYNKHALSVQGISPVNVTTKVQEDTGIRATYAQTG